jgi:hypothetical protein
MDSTDSSKPEMETRATHRRGAVRRLSVSLAPTTGWQVREERDDRVFRAIVLSDWHRVERARKFFDLDTPEDEGWTKAEAHSTNR